MKWIGLTGGMGTGKSTVAGIIQTLGYTVMSADKLAHNALNKDSPVFQQILGVFGQDYLDSNGQFDRKKLGSLVFQDKFLLGKLEAIVHPYIQDIVQTEKARLAQLGTDLAFYEVPLLFEKRLEKRFDRIVLVTCRRETQIERAILRTNLTREQVLLRLKHQVSEELKMKHAHYIIRNDSSVEELKMKVQDVMLQLKKDLKII